jgi:hypothetical protein
MGDSSINATLSALGARNSDVPWDSFNSLEYYWHNYGHLRDDDHQIIGIVADFFVHCFDRSAPPKRLAKAIDVGTGTNLYPALTMLPYSSSVTLFERSFPNRQWLTDQLARPHSTWQEEFWPVIAADRGVCLDIRNPLGLLHDRAEVTKGNLFELKPDQYDLGTMFFVAESITTRDDEFRRAIQLFVGSLMPGAPFAATFMRRSQGYYVGDTLFPACSIVEDDVRACLAPVARIRDIETVESHGLRDGYSGMIVATGWKR